MIRRLRRFRRLGERGLIPSSNLRPSAQSADHFFARSKGQRIARGFTLLELVLVMLLLTLILGMAVPSLRGFANASRARDAQSQLVALAQYAKARAAAESRAYRLNTDGESYWLTAQEGEDFVETGTDMGRTFSLPPDTRVELDSTDPDAVAGGIDFHPDGRSDTVRLRLIDERTGAVTTIACPSPAEPFRVLSQEEAMRL
jgi:prepilin-type N-terminal cleavage/methylation domain-containing protein